MQGLIDYLSGRYRKVVEVGIGSYARVAVALKEKGLEVVAVDIQPRPEAVAVVADDVRSPRLDYYCDAQAIYAVRPPPELVPALKRLARRLGVDLVIKPLASEAVGGQLLSGGGSFFYIFPYGRAGWVPAQLLDRKVRAHI